MSVSLQIIEGTPGINEQDVAHLIIPGRYRSPDGMGLHPFAEQRVATAAGFYVGHALTELAGIIVCPGYKNPGDVAGEPWRDEMGTEFQGIPEGYSMRTSLAQNYGIPLSSVRVEVESIDTVTNFTNSQGLFPDDRPVGIVAQEQQLDRILKIVAPRTMRRDYLGIVTPELPANIDKDGLAERLASRYIARGLSPELQDSPQIATERANQAWNVVLGIKSLVHPFVGKVAAGHSESA